VGCFSWLRHERFQPTKKAVCASSDAIDLIMTATHDCSHAICLRTGTWQKQQATKQADEPAKCMIQHGLSLLLID
jgi:hypothetical protein